MGAGRQARKHLFLLVCSISMWWLRLQCHAWTASRPSLYRRSTRLFSVAVEWKGSSHSTSDFVTHVLVGGDSPSVERAIAAALPKQASNDNTTDASTTIPLDNSMLTPKHYLELGSVWFLPADAPRDPSQGQKPVRLQVSDLQSTLKEGDYLRVHHTPRRFPLVYNYNWTSDKQDDSNGVVVARDDDKGYWVIDKPAHVPVHPTVDNVFENVASMIQQARQEQGEKDVYVTTTQRLDQNTSGLFVVATSKPFAAYFAKLLRRKTEQQLASNSSILDAIHKRYKCLVCLIDSGSGWSVATAMHRLQKYADEQRVMRHYLEPSIRAPKHFAATPGNDTWVECLLRIKNVGPTCPLVGSEAGRDLATDLWSDKGKSTVFRSLLVLETTRPILLHGNRLTLILYSDAIPTNCVAVVEVEVELLTGRTHQIRGQLLAEGFPLVGDAQYGGAIPQEKEGELKSMQYIHSDQLALQCSQLEFLDPDVIVKNDGTEVLVPSDRWNTFQLHDCWWTSMIEKYQAQSSTNDIITTNLDDIGRALDMREIQSGEHESDRETQPDDLLPPRVQLTPGAHKYIMVKATRSSENEDQWFVKSAAPSECGGPYHANVAKDLVEWLQAAGYDTMVTGGGRIEYKPETQEACVYGFSYGFGKGDHEKAASIISEWSNGSIKVTYDNSDSLY